MKFIFGGLNLFVKFINWIISRLIQSFCFSVLSVQVSVEVVDFQEAESIAVLSASGDVTVSENR